jgi:hypothetical protein
LGACHLRELLQFSDDPLWTSGASPFSFLPVCCIAGWGKVKLGRTVCNRNSDLQSEQQGRNGDCVER